MSRGTSTRDIRSSKYSPTPLKLNVARLGRTVRGGGGHWFVGSEKDLWDLWDSNLMLKSSSFFNIDTHVATWPGEMCAAPLIFSRLRETRLGADERNLSV